MGRLLTREEWQRRKRLKDGALFISAGTLFVVNIFVLVLLMIEIFSNPVTETLSSSLSIKKMYLTPNEYSRPQTKLDKVKGIVIHYVANPNTSAEQNRNYFESLKDTKERYASSHYIIGLEGEIIQCIPNNEWSYSADERNSDTISIECCHPDETGKFNNRTYASLVKLVSELCVEYNIEEEGIIRHYDVTEKMCPLYYVEHEDEWLLLKNEIGIATNKLRAVNKDRN